MKKYLLLVSLFVFAVIGFSSCDDNSSDPDFPASTQYSIVFSYNSQALGANSNNFINSFLKPAILEPALFGSSLTHSYNTGYVGAVYSESSSLNSSFYIENAKVSNYDKLLDSIFKAYDSNINSLKSGKLSVDSLRANERNVLFLNYNIKISKENKPVYTKELLVFLPYINGTKWHSESDNSKYIEFVNDSICKISLTGQEIEYKYQRSKATSINIKDNNDTQVYTMLFNEVDNSKKAKIIIGGTDYVFIRE